MFFELDGYVKMSKSVNEVKDDIEKVVETSNNQFSKVVVKDYGRITEWKINKEKIIVKIVSGGSPRPHECLIRFKKNLVEALGKKHKIGAREIFAEKYTVEFETEKEALKPVTLPLVFSHKLEGNKCTLIFENLDENTLQKNYVDRLIKLVNDKIKFQYYEGKEEFKEYVWESGEKKFYYDKDPSDEMEKLNWVKRTTGKGQFVFGREYTALHNTFRELIAKHIYENLGFNEMIFPKFEPWEVPMKSGHIANTLPNFYFVFVPKRSTVEFWEEVSDNFKVTGNIDKEGVIKRCDSVGILSYAQCPPFWPYLEGKIIDEKTLPLKIYDWSGPTYRNESGGTHGIDRLEEFHRIETLWVGTKQQVVEVWNKLRETFSNFFDDVLDLEFKVARVSPWWMAHAGMKTEKGTPETGTFDFEAYLPYRGDRKTEWLEIQNTSSNGNKYPKAFTVKGRKQELWSGCAGGSLERWIVAFLAQKGFDTKKWPKEVRESFHKKIKEIKPLKYY